MAPYQLRDRTGKHSDKRSQSSSSPKNLAKAVPRKTNTKKGKNSAQKKAARMTSRTGESPTTPQTSQSLDPRAFERSLAPSPPTLAARRILDAPSIPPLPAVLAGTVNGSELFSLPPSPSLPARTRMSAPHPPSPSPAVRDEEVENFLATIRISVPKSTTPPTSPPSYLSQGYFSAKVGATASSSAPGMSERLMSYTAAGGQIPDQPLLSEADAPPVSLSQPAVLSSDTTHAFVGREALHPPSETTDVVDAECCYRSMVKYHQVMGVSPPPRPSPSTMKRIDEDLEYRAEYFSVLEDLTPQYDRLPDLSKRRWLVRALPDERDKGGLGDEEGDENMTEAAREEKDSELQTLVETIKTLCGQYNALRQTLQRDAAPDIYEAQQCAAWYRRGTAQVHAELDRIRAWAAYWNPGAKSMWSTKEVWTRFPLRLKRKDGLWMELAEDEDRGSEDDYSDDEVEASGSTAPGAAAESGPSGSTKARRFSGIRPTARSPPPSAAFPSNENEEDGSSDDEEDKPDEGGNSGAARASPPAPAASQRPQPAYGVIRRPRSHTPESDDSSAGSVIGSDPDDPDATGSRILALSAEAQHYLYKVALEQETRQSGSSMDGGRSVRPATPPTHRPNAGPSSSLVGNSAGLMTTPPLTPVRNSPLAGCSNAPASQSTNIAAATAAAPVCANAASRLKGHRPSPPAYVHRPTGQKRERNPKHPGVSTRQPELNPRPAKKRRIRYNSSDESDVEEGSSGSLRRPSTPVVNRLDPSSGPSTPSGNKQPAFSIPAAPSPRTSSMGPPSSPLTRPSASPSSPAPSSSTMSRKGRPLVRTATPMNPLAPIDSSPNAGTSGATRVTGFQDVSDGRMYLVPTDKLKQKVAQLDAASKLSELNRQREGLLPPSSSAGAGASSGSMLGQHAASSTDERAPPLSRQAPREVELPPSPPPAAPIATARLPGPSTQPLVGLPGVPLSQAGGSSTRISTEDQHSSGRSAEPDDLFAPHKMVPFTVAHLPEPLRKLWLQTKQITQQPEDDSGDDMQDVEDSFDVERMLEDAPSDAGPVQRDLDDEVKALADEADLMAAACAAGELTDEQIEGIVNGTLKFEKRPKASKVTELTMRRLPFWKNPNESPEAEDEAEAVVFDVGGDTESDTDAATEVDEEAPQAGQDGEGDQKRGEQGGATECVGKGKGRADGQPSGTFNMSAE